MRIFHMIVVGQNIADAEEIAARWDRRLNVKVVAKVTPRSLDRARGINAHLIWTSPELKEAARARAMEVLKPCTATFDKELQAEFDWWFQPLNTKGGD